MMWVYLTKKGSGIAIRQAGEGYHGTGAMCYIVTAMMVVS